MYCFVPTPHVIFARVQFYSRLGIFVLAHLREIALERSFPSAIKKILLHVHVRVNDLNKF